MLQSVLLASAVFVSVVSFAPDASASYVPRLLDAALSLDGGAARGPNLFGATLLDQGGGGGTGADYAIQGVLALLTGVTLSVAIIVTAAWIFVTSVGI